MSALRWSAVLVLTAGLLGTPARADVKPHNLFSDNMVLQRDAAVPVWGVAADGEKVTVRFQDQEKSTTAKDGKWLVRLDKLQAGGQPGTLTIAGKKNKVELKNVVVGEVWICSGQSNMEWSIKASADPAKTAAESADPELRLFTVMRTAVDQPREDVSRTAEKGVRYGEWLECGPETSPAFSAVAYHFGRHLRKTLGVPVGLINTSWGGTPAEAWTSRAALDAHPELKALKGGNFTQLYNGMIAPLAPFAMCGAIWYQGESNGFALDRAKQYRVLLPTMIKNWRDAWKQGDFPFLLVQLAPWSSPRLEEGLWGHLRESQLRTTQTVPNTAQAVITDVGDEKDIHPPQKEPVGARLALAARALAYGEKVEYSGPVYERMSVEGNRAVLHFTHVGAGLEARGGELTGFTVAGADGKFVKAKAEVRGDTVVVSSDEVDKPAAVRYGWANFPVVNLWNKDGLPATPFRTDGDK